MPNDSKEAHELFVSNLSGTTPAEVLCISLVLPTAIWLMKLLYLWELRYSLWIEQSVIILPLLSCLTFWSDHVFLILLLLGSACICRSLYLLFLQPKGWRALMAMPAGMPTQKRLPLISEYRSSLLIMTAICILAVDFPLFPRRFAKAETYGWGLMDPGVGTFVVINALTGPETHLKSSRNGLYNIQKAITSSIPLIFLGLIRLVTVKASNYQEHVSEYGVHWNFFFTLAGIKIISSLIMAIFSPSPPFYSILSVILILLHQTMLSTFGTDFILTDDRDSFLKANKEGLLSLLGYVSIYFMFLGYRRMFLDKRSTVKDWLMSVLKLFTFGYLSWISMLIVHEEIQNVSRRMANLSYFLWMVSHNSLVLGFLLLIHLIACILISSDAKYKNSKQRPIVLLEAVNFNALPFFLISNILTGLINVCVNTLYCNSIIALTIIYCYLSLLCHISVFLYSAQIKLFRI